MTLRRPYRQPEGRIKTALPTVDQGPTAGLPVNPTLGPTKKPRLADRAASKEGATMPRTIHTLAAAITALVIGAPAAPASAAAEPVSTASTAATTSTAKEHPRSPNARYPTPCDIAAALAQEAYYMGKPAPLKPAKRCQRWRNTRDAARPKTPSDITAALAQERYYSSYGEPEPLTPPTGAPEIRTHNGIAPAPFVVAVVAALIVGLATGSRLQLLRARRRHATGLAT
jgi:hypothetical protein